MSIAAAHAEQPTLLHVVTNEKIEFPSGGTFQLAPPTLRSGMTAEQRLEKLSHLAGNAGWKRFSRDSAVAPVAIKIKYLNDSEGNRVGHSLHIAFVVHASIGALKNRDLMQQMFGDESESEHSEEAKRAEVSDQLLSELGIVKTENTSFANAEIELLKKVNLRGVLQIQQAATDSE